MSAIATTRMSSKGQVVIPEEVRERLGLEPGVQFVVVGDQDMVMLKVVSPPSLSQFDRLVREARAKARQARLRKSDVSEALGKARNRS